MKPLDRRQKILNLLELEPRLTAVQVAKLAYPTNDVRVINGRAYPKTYQSARNMLVRMEKDKDIKRQAFTFTGDWFMLPETDKKTKWRYAHETACADLFTSLYLSLDAWIVEPYIGNKRADRGMKYNGKIIYFEVDLCTEKISILEEKIENYLRHTDDQSHVVFSLLGESKEVTKRGNLLIPYLQKICRGNRFLIANHTKLVGQPFEPILYAPTDELLSLKML